MLFHPPMRNFCLLLLVFLCSCQRKVCPSYESAFLRDQGVRMRLFTPFEAFEEYEEYQEEGVLDEDLDEDLDEALEDPLDTSEEPFGQAAAADAEAEEDGTLEEERLYSFLGGKAAAFYADDVMPIAQAPRVRKNKKLLIGWYPPAFLKRHWMRTVHTRKPKIRWEEEEEATDLEAEEEVEEVEEDIFWQEEEEAEEGREEEAPVEAVVSGEEEEEPLALSNEEAQDEPEDELEALLRELEEDIEAEENEEEEETETADGIETASGEDGEEVLEEEEGREYLYGYNPTDNHNMDQVFYNTLFGHLFLAPPKEEAFEEEEETKEAIEELDIPGEYSEERYREYLEKEAAEDEDEILEDESLRDDVLDDILKGNVLEDEEGEE